MPQRQGCRICSYLVSHCQLGLAPISDPSILTYTAAEGGPAVTFLNCDRSKERCRHSGNPLNAARQWLSDSIDQGGTRLNHRRSLPLLRIFLRVVYASVSKRKLRDPFSSPLCSRRFPDPGRCASRRILRRRLAPRLCWEGPAASIRR